MKVVVIEFSGKGAMAHYVFQLCRGMAANGADVTLITARDYELPSLPRNFTLDASLELWDPKPTGRQSNAWWAVAFRKLRRVARAAKHYRQWLRVINRVARMKPDVVQLGDVRFSGDYFPLWLMRRRVKRMADVCHNVRPYATSGKNVGSFDRSRLLHFFYKRIYHLFDVVFVHFDRNRAEFRDTFQVRDEKIGVIVHGNEEIFAELASPTVDAAALRKRYGLPADARVVLFFGTLSRYKGTDILIAAFPEIHRATGAHLVLAGFPFHGFDVEAHRELTRQHGIERAVTWVPEYIPTEEVAAWMKLASVAVYPYRDVYQSGALHVAQTFGIPIVATAAGAMQDVVEHEVSGMLVPSENPPALAEAITRILQDSELATMLGTNSLRDAQGRFAWKTIGKILVDRYQQL